MATPATWRSCKLGLQTLLLVRQRQLHDLVLVSQDRVLADNVSAVPNYRHRSHVLVTSNAGFVGANLTAALVHGGYRVTVWMICRPGMR